MFPIKMIYQPTEKDKEFFVDAYSFDHTQDLEGNLISTFITAWVSKNKTWITAPVWCFKPVENKTLTEDL